MLWPAHILFNLIGWLLISLAGGAIFDSYPQSLEFFVIHGVPAAFLQTFLVASIKWQQSQR